MKLNKISVLLLGAMAFASCSDIDEQNPESGSITGGQVQETTDAISSRIDANLNGMYTMAGTPCSVFGLTQGRADDFGLISAALSQDLEGADMFSANNNFNWFSTANELSSRNPDYANPYARYTLPYRQIGVAEQIIATINLETADAKGKAQAGQAYAMRAFDYMALAPYFQFGYATSKDQPCVPIIGKSGDATNNPRATVAEVYEQIINDLTKAIELLDGFQRTDKTQIDQNVAYGLRARAYLAMDEWAKAAADADKAMQGYTPASIADVSVPAFDDINEKNWMWGFDMTDAMVSGDAGYSNPSSWFSAFSGDGYAPATMNVPCINILLYNKIPTTDVRKGWWLDANKHSPNWANLTWGDAKGDEIADLTTDDGGKVPFDAYTSIKFGQQSGVGSTLNNNDFPFMRVEEMILIKAEGLAKSGHEAEAKKVLEDFVKTYRDPSYSVTAGGRSLADEIWFQRRVELWGEGFFTADAKRLGKNIVRFHEGQESNVPDAFKFNIKNNDGWLNMRFATREKDNNLGIIDNTEGSQPVPGQNPELRDGVTD